MPLDLIVPFETRRQMPSPGDKGFLIGLTKSRWNKQTGIEMTNFLKSFAQQYYEEKCPEEAVHINGNGDTEGSSRRNSNNTSGIQFLQIDMVHNNCGFIASNLADPSDYVHFIFTKLAEEKSLPKTSKAYRVMPVEAVCEARPKDVEKAVLPLIEKKLGNSNEPLRFSLIFRGHSFVSTLPQPEAKAVIRNCIWSVNPNCVQCIKYQDFAVCMHMLNPYFLIGIGDDFQRLGGYNTWTIRQGQDRTDQGVDSEDDISDDPELDEEEEKKRKLRIKRKRRAQKAGLSLSEAEAKRSAEGRNDDENEEEDDEDHGGEGHPDHGADESHDGHDESHDGHDESHDGRDGHDESHDGLDQEDDHGEMNE